MSNPPAPFLNRLVDQMLERADPRADQNIWDLARAAEEVYQEVKGEALRALYTITPAPTVASPTGRMVVSPVPQTFATSVPDYAAQLGEIERRFALKYPTVTGVTTADKVDHLIQDHQAASHNFTAARRQVEGLEASLAECTVTLQTVRKALDPDGQFEGMTLGGVARERMNQLAARRDEIKRLERELQEERA